MLEHGPIVVVVDDLMVGSRVESACRASGWRAEFPRDVESFWAKVRGERPSLIMVAMSTKSMPWETLVTSLKRDPELGGVPILAFGSHMDLEMRQRALAAGSDRVVANSQVALELPSLLRQMGLLSAPAEA